MRLLHSAQATYQATQGSGSFGTLENLRHAGLIDAALATGEKYGYQYSVATVAAIPGQSAARFTVVAVPRAYRKTGIRSFFVDQRGEIRGKDYSLGPATSTDPVIDDCTNGSVIDNERCTILDMRAVAIAQSTYAATVGNGNYGSFPQLYLAGLIRAGLADYSSRGYDFEVQTVDREPGVNDASFKIWATPSTYGVTAIRSFYVDQTGVLRGADRSGGQADQNDPPITK